MIMSHMLATFDIMNALNEQGEKIVPAENYCTGLVRYVTDTPDILRHQLIDHITCNSRPDPFPLVFKRRVH